MAHLSRPLRNASQAAVRPDSRRSGSVRVWVGGRSRRPWVRPLGLLLVSLGLASGGLLLTLSFRWGLWLMLNPEALAPWLGEAAQDSSPQIISLAAWRQALADQQQTLGEAFTLAEDSQGSLLLIPTLEGQTGQIIRLTLCRRTRRQSPQEDATDALTWLAEVAVPPADRQVIWAPLAANTLNPSLAPQSFPFTRLLPLPQPPSPSPLAWLTLAGEWSAAGINLRYGQILVVDSDHLTLTLVDPWSSPANRIPQWVDLDGQGHQDLVVDQTLGLEPSLQGWQVVAATGQDPPLRLLAVDWRSVPIDAGSQAMAYQTALRLARQGLWGEASQRLSQLKATLAQRWNGTAEAQLRMIAQHQSRAHQQAEQDWALPAQQVVAQLIDGRWEAALRLLESDPSLLEPMLRRLGVDQGRLWNRMMAATTLPNPDPAAFVWAGLTLKAQPHAPAAQGWLTRQPVPPQARQRLAALLAQPTPRAQTPTPSPVESSSPGMVAASPAMAAPLPALEGLLGLATPLAAVDRGQWYVPPGLSMEADAGQWYAIQVRSVRHRAGWDSDWVQGLEQTTPAQVWSALTTRGQTRLLTLWRWLPDQQGVATTLTVQGLALGPGNLTLLATGPGLGDSPRPLLAFSERALTWLSPPSGQAGLSQAAIATIAGLILPQPAVVPPALADTLGTVSQHSLDLTGNGRAERILHLDGPILSQLEALGGNLDPTAPKTVILDLNDQILYSDLLQPQSLVALTNPNDGVPAALLVYRQGDYNLVPWSEARQRFEEGLP